MWHGIYGHDEVVEQFRRALSRQRLASSFLFVGPPGVGKKTFAMKFAQALLCLTRPEQAMDPCEECPGCVQVKSGTHPDLQVVAKPPDKSSLPLELLIGDKEHRMREGLCHDIALRPFMGGRKVAIIDDADYLAAEGANCLLKTLEEPPPNSCLILIGTSPAKQLPTIRSRCQLIRFRPLADETVADLLAAQGITDTAERAEKLARHSEGSLTRAIELADADLWEFRQQLFARLGEPVLESVRLSKTVAGFVEKAGKEAAPRRDRLRQIAIFAADFYRQLLRALAGDDSRVDADLRTLILAAAAHWSGREEAAAACLDRCLEAIEQVDRNAYQPTLIEAWLDRLAALGTPPRA